ncbi:MAG: hypothetical protein GEU79_00475 [Acidimicrobiia bacterium]|nr:hypothetical protein [Acidimicrobiia bacterium]
MDKVRLGSVGLGRWGRLLADAALESGRYEVITGFARTPETRQEFAEAYDCRAAASLDELLSDGEVEAVFIASAHDVHREQIEAAAAAGKHVFVEKPFTLSVADGRAAVDAATAAGIVLQVGHQRRRLPGIRGMKALIDEGAIGDIQMLEANHSLPNGFTMPEQAWRWNADQSPLGSMTSLGIHQIETFHYLVGPIATVSAQTRVGRDFSIDEATGLLFEFESGAIGTLLTSFFTPWVVRVAIHGTDGAATSDRDGAELEYKARGEREGVDQPLDPVDPIVDQLVEFADAVRGDGTPEVGGEEGLEVITVLEAAVASAQSGSSVAVADHRR